MAVWREEIVLEEEIEGRLKNVDGVSEVVI